MTTTVIWLPIHVSIDPAAAFIFITHFARRGLSHR